MDQRFHVGASEVDASLHTLTGPGGSRRLEPKVLQVLLRLAVTPGEVVSKRDLMDAAWPDTFVGDEVLTRAISELRRAFGDDRRHPRVIETIPKGGYRLVAPVTTAAAAAPPAAAGDPQAEREAVDRSPPQGQSVAVGAPPQASRRFAVLASVLAIAGAAAVWFGSTPGAGSAPVRSVVVLPVTDLGAQEGADQFAAGLTEALITTLSQSGAFLTVVKGRPRSAGPAVGPEDTARRLGADAALVSSVLRTSARVRMTARLVDGRTGLHLWSGSYDRATSDLMAMQHDLVADLTASVSVPFDGSVRRAADRPAQVEARAYDYYLRGLGALQRYEVPDLVTALSLFDRSIEAAPGLAPAWAARAIVLFHLPLRGGPVPWREAVRRGAHDAEVALELDAGLGSASSAAASFAWARREWQRSEALHRRAITLDPSNPIARVDFAHFLATRARYDEAIGQARRAVELDPANVFTLGHLAWAYYNARRYPDAADAWLSAREISSEGDPAVEGMLALALGGAGRVGEVERICIDGRALRAWCACAYAAAGRRDQARSIERAMPAQDRASFELQACLGNADAALDRIEAAMRSGDDPLVLFIRGPTMYEYLRGNSRYQALLKELSLPQ